jgi:CheY-like chemotaxis protein
MWQRGSMLVADPEAIHRRETRVLVVNDNALLAESVRKLLQSEGYDTRVAHDGLEALDVLAAWQADIILLDLMMPKLDGFGFLAQHGADPNLARSRVVVWSVASVSELKRAQALGAVECLSTSSTRPDDLLETLARLMATPPRRQALIGSRCKTPHTALRRC